jgi:hypothetical protein
MRTLLALDLGIAAALCWLRVILLQQRLKAERRPEVSAARYALLDSRTKDEPEVYAEAGRRTLRRKGRWTFAALVLTLAALAAAGSAL